MPGVSEKIRGVILENTFTSVADMTEALWSPLKHIKFMFTGQWNSISKVDKASSLSRESIHHILVRTL